MAYRYDVRMKGKQRLSVSVDGELVEAAVGAVERGRAPTLSAWVSDAMRLKQAHDRRLEGMAAFIAEYEAEFGEITEDEMLAAERSARARALTVRPPDLKRRARK